jgi:hypothetical protein
MRFSKTPQLYLLTIKRVIKKTRQVTASDKKLKLNLLYIFENEMQVMMQIRKE